MKSSRLYYVLQVLELHTTNFLDYRKEKHKFYQHNNKNSLYHLKVWSSYLTQFKIFANMTKKKIDNKISY
jgi:hypothetical protein